MAFCASSSVATRRTRTLGHVRSRGHARHSPTGPLPRDRRAPAGLVGENERLPAQSVRPTIWTPLSHLARHARAVRRGDASFESTPARMAVTLAACARCEEIEVGRLVGSRPGQRGTKRPLGRRHYTPSASETQTRVPAKCYRAKIRRAKTRVTESRAGKEGTGKTDLVISEAGPIQRIAEDESHAPLAFGQAFRHSVWWRAASRASAI